MRFRNNLIHFSHQLSAWYSIEYSRLLREIVKYFHAARPARKRVYEFFGLRSNVPPANPQEYRKIFFSYVGVSLEREERVRFEVFRTRQPMRCFLLHKCFNCAPEVNFSFTVNENDLEFVR